MKALLLALFAAASMAHATDLSGPAEFQFFQDFNKVDGTYAGKFSVNWDNVTSAELFTQGYSLCYKGDTGSVTTLFEAMLFQFKEAYPGAGIAGNMGSYEKNNRTYMTLEIVLSGRENGHSKTYTYTYSAIPACVR